MAVAKGLFNLLPSCSHHFYLAFYFLPTGSSKKKKKKKKIGCFLSLSQKAGRGKCVCSVWEVKAGCHGRGSPADARATLTN